MSNPVTQIVEKALQECKKCSIEDQQDFIQQMPDTLHKLVKETIRDVEEEEKL